MAVLWADLLWPVLLLLGVEHVGLQPNNSKFPLDFTDYPITHSLLMGMVWGFIFGFIYWLVKKDIRSAVVVGICVVSHWVLDWVTHGPDMPLVPGGARYGLGLWNSVTGTMVVEIVMFAVGVWMYVRVTRAKDRIGRWAFIAYVVLLIAIYIADAFSPPPDNVVEIAWAGVAAAVILIPWAWWFDRHRSSVSL